jgi:hypothetical protein
VLDDLVGTVELECRDPLVNELLEMFEPGLPRWGRIGLRGLLLSRAAGFIEMLVLLKIIGIPFRGPGPRRDTRFLTIKRRLGWDQDPVKGKYSCYTCRHTFAHRMLSGYSGGVLPADTTMSRWVASSSPTPAQTWSIIPDQEEG